MKKIIVSWQGKGKGGGGGKEGTGEGREATSVGWWVGGEVRGAVGGRIEACWVFERRRTGREVGGGKGAAVKCEMGQRCRLVGWW